MPRRKEYTTADLTAILGESMIWPEGLEAKRYERIHDDHDGTGEGSVVVMIGHDGDAWLYTCGVGPCASLRYRTMAGGGRSTRVRNALLLLAFAIKLEEDEERSAMESVREKVK